MTHFYTYLGGTPLWFADAVGPDGKVIYTDFDSKNANIAGDFLRGVNLIDRVHFHVGDAMDYIENSNQQYDIIFIDHDKTQYLDALDIAVSKLKDGGLVIADNTLLRGTVRWNLDEENTKIIKKFNHEVFNRADLRSVLLPLKDGITISMKISQA